MNRIRNIHCLLTKLHIFSTTPGGVKFVTISVVLPVIKYIMKVLEESDDDYTYISDMKNIMLADFKVCVKVKDVLDVTLHMRDDIFKKLETEMMNKSSRQG